jgi:hypothetical protein
MKNIYLGSIDFGPPKGLFDNEMAGRNYYLVYSHHTVRSFGPEYLYPDGTLAENCSGGWYPDKQAALDCAAEFGYTVIDESEGDYSTIYEEEIIART